MAPKRRILVVDDDLEVTDYLKGYFKDEGLEVSTASTGEEALALLAQNEPALMLLDMRLGSGLSGMEVLRRAKKKVRPETPIIVVTAVEDQNVAEMAKGLGAVDYLTKPLVLEELKRVVLSRLKT